MEETIKKLIDLNQILHFQTMANSGAVFDDLILHICPDKFYLESLTATQVQMTYYHYMVR